MTTPDRTVVESDGSWIGRTIVALVVIALLVVGAIWLFNNVGDGDGGVDSPVVENNVDGGDGGDGADSNTDTDTDTNVDPNPVSS